MKLLATSIASLLLMNSLIAQAAPAAESGVAQPAKVYGRYIEARSDFAWENDLVAFRAYGPKLRDGEENAGIDCWLKRVTYPIIDNWYRQEAEQQISYHQDHGEGLDNFQVGSSLGVGGTGIMINDKLELLETFTQYAIKKQTNKELVFTLT